MEKEVKKKIVVGVCGSVAAIETPRIIREFVRNGIDVECVMTDSARKIINENVLEWASGNKVIVELTGAVEHVRLCGIDGEASLLLICPATANTISKIANGIDDTTVTTFASTALGSGIPVVVCPAMHYSIYNNPFVIQNVKKLKDEGVIFIEPKIEENKAKLNTKR
ncbi:MAG: DNA/pantothenate metabolism flavoprotein, partial [Candidatus Altiarchaeales archaeon]